MNDIVYKELSYILTGLCFKAHREIGRFCREKQYADRLEQLLQEEGIPYHREYEIKVFNPVSPKGNKADFFIDGKILLDTKAKPYLLKEDYAQMQRYLTGAELRLGLIVNFRNRYLKPAQVLNSRHSRADLPDSHRGRGFTLVESVIYIGLLVFVLVAAANMLLMMGRAYGFLKFSRHMQTSAVVSLDRIVRAARDARSIDVGQSTLGASPGALVLNTTAADGNPQTVEFRVVNGALRVWQDGIDAGPLTLPDVAVGSLIFREVQTGVSQAVKIELALQTGIGATLRTEKFYGTAVLRDSY